MKRLAFPTTIALLLIAAPAYAGTNRGQLETDDLPRHLRDRGTGVPLSIFGTYLQKGQLIVYPFYEYYWDGDAEYSPAELGLTEDVDYRGIYEASETLLFLGYGITDRLAIELEGAVIQAELETSTDDTSGLPPEIQESGVGDVEGQLRYRLTEERGSRPEFFSYFETVGPTQDKGSLIGTSDWEFKLGAGAIRGFSFGTMTLRAAVEYDRAEGAAELGEMAIEYLRRLSTSWRVFGAFEGTQDEIEFITEVQWHMSPRFVLKLNHAYGVTSKATDLAPEVGLMMFF